jgi:hypothetical protein
MPEPELGQPSPEEGLLFSWARDNLRLPDEFYSEFRELKRLLKDAYEVTERTLGRPAEGRQRLVDEATSKHDASHRYLLLHIPPTVLSAPRERERDFESFYYLSRILPRNSRVLIFSIGLNLIHIDLRNLILEWQREGIAIDFVSWSYVETLLASKEPDRSRQLRWVLEVLARPTT